MWLDQPALGRSQRVLRVNAVFLAFALLLLPAPLLLAQGDTGVIHGRVTDSRGQAQRVRVQLLAAGDIPAGDRYTGNEGEYVFEALPSGEYQIAIEAAGFRAVRLPVNLDIRLNPNVQANVVLEADGVTGKAPSPVVSGSASSHTVDARKSPVAVDARALREYNKGRNEDSKGNLESAADHYRKALRTEPDYYPALNNLGALYEREGRHAQAQEVLILAIRANPDDGQAYVNLGHSLYEEGRLGEAAIRLEEGLKRSPNSAAGRFFLGSVQLKLGDTVSAESNLKRACALNPQGLAAAHLQLANVYLKTHDVRQAATELQTYLKANPSDPQAPAIRGLLARVTTSNP